MPQLPKSEFLCGRVSEGKTKKIWVRNTEHHNMVLCTYSNVSNCFSIILILRVIIRNKNTLLILICLIIIGIL